MDISRSAERLAGGGVITEDQAKRLATTVNEAKDRLDRARRRRFHPLVTRSGRLIVNLRGCLARAG